MLFILRFAFIKSSHSRARLGARFNGKAILRSETPAHQEHHRVAYAPSAGPVRLGVCLERYPLPSPAPCGNDHREVFRILAGGLFRQAHRGELIDNLLLQSRRYVERVAPALLVLDAELSRCDLES